MRSASVVLVLTLASGLGSGGAASAAPLLSGAETLPDGQMLFPDTKEKDLFYFVPGALRLGERDGRPQFHFYKSVAIGAEPGAVSGGGVVALTLERPYPGAATLARWRESKGDAAEFRPLTATQVTCRLILTRVAHGDRGAGVLTERRAAWSMKSIALALDRATATLLWTALESPGNLALVADVELVAPGWVLDSGPDGSRQYRRQERIDRFSLPLAVSRREHPELFSLIHVADERSFAYRELTVFCFDFAEDRDGVLALILVDIRLETPRGQVDRHTLRFSPRSDPMRTIEFRVPAGRDQPYRYRVTRVFDSGAQAAGSWKESHHAQLDVSHYAIETHGTDPSG